jgi:hypothetical protein
MQTRNLEVVVPKRREGSSPFERTIFSHLISLGFPLSNPVSQKPVVGFLCSFLEQDLVSEMLATIEDQEGHQPR